MYPITVVPEQDSFTYPEPAHPEPAHPEPVHERSAYGTAPAGGYAGAPVLTAVPAPSGAQAYVAVPARPAVSTVNTPVYDELMADWMAAGRYWPGADRHPDWAAFGYDAPHLSADLRHAGHASGAF
ncbi:hypothetical protein [Streptomyces sp. NPDC089919]|uniref:hypothetical protein n=1 Tax=Streptomyces sp. NPDC089919 TaxID=3155188 RepID=UPI00343A174C